MFLTVERATTRNFVRVLVILLAAALLCGSYPITLMARETDRAPCEMPGDAEDINGYKNFEFESSPTGGSTVLPDFHQPTGSRQATIELRIKLAVILVNLYLVARK